MVGRLKKNLRSVGAGVPFLVRLSSSLSNVWVPLQVFRFLVRLFSDLSGIVPCQTYGFPLDGAPVHPVSEGFFLDPFCVAFFGTFFVW